MPEVRIIVREERQGTALRDAARDAEALENRRGRTVDWAALQRQREEAAQATQGSAPRAADAPASQRLRKQAAQAEHEAIMARAAGNTDDAAKLERKAEILRRTVALQHQLGVSEAQGRVMASQQVGAEEQIAAAKAQTVAAERKKKEESLEATRAAREHERKQREEARAGAKGRQEREQVGRQLDKNTFNREVYEDEVRAMEMRANGDHKGADALQRQNALRTRAVQLQRELGVGHSDAARMAEREMQILEKTTGRSGGAAQAMGMVAGRAGLPVGGGAAGPLALAMAAAHIFTQTATSEFNFRDTKAMERGNLERQMSRTRQIRFGTFGDSASDREEAAISDRRRNKQELDEAEAAKGHFKTTTLSNILTLGGLLGETDGQKAERENEEKIKRLQADRPMVGAEAMRQFQHGQGGRELELSRRTAAGDRVGARAIEHEMLWWQEYDRLKNKLGEKGEAIAQESANNAVTVAMRNSNMKFAGMLNARSGAGDIARAADLMSGGIHSYREPAAEAVKSLGEQIREQHLDIKTHMPPPGHMHRPDLRGRPL